MNDTRQRQIEQLSLVDSLNGEWLKLPVAVMKDCGPAAQTLAGLWKITNKETFVPVADIAKTARLPLPTVRKHLVTLAERGWIENRGRGKTRVGRPRRTATIAIMSQTKEAMADYNVLPWWACCSIKPHGHLPWGTKAVLSVVISRLMSLKAVAEREESLNEEELLGALDNLGGVDRFSFSLRQLDQRTGLARPAIVMGKRHLHRLKIVYWRSDTSSSGATAADKLVPNMRFRVVVTPTSPGCCYLAFKGS